MIELLASERGTTDRMLAAERQHSDRSLGAREDLLAVVAHDLRNMVSTILVNASVIVMRPDADTATGRAAHIQHVGAKMTQLLEELLDYSSFEAGKLTLTSSDVDIVELVRDAVAILAEVAKEHSSSSSGHSTVHRYTSARMDAGSRAFCST